MLDLHQEKQEMQSRNTIIACLFGNMLEWYDFSLYALLATIIAQHFFSDLNSHTALLSSFGIFAVGYLMRPLGGVVLGHIGDKFSRKYALILTILTMGMATALIGLLPGYDTWGALAVVLLTLLRMIQGLGVGGEYPGSMVILVETASPQRKAFTASLSFVGAICGNTLASSVTFLVHHLLGQQAFTDWGWRLPFLLGLILALLGLYIRLKLWQKQTNTNDIIEHIPLIALLKKYRKAFFKALAIWSFTGIYTGIMLIFLFTYLTHYLHFPTSMGYLFQIPLLIMSCIIYVGSAYIVDKKQNPRQWMMIWFMILIIVAYPLYRLAQLGPNMTVLALFIIAAMSMCAQGPIVLVITALFPRQVRYTGTGLSMGLAMSLFAGTAPMILIVMIKYIGLTAPAFYLMLGALLAVLGLSKK